MTGPRALLWQVLFGWWESRYFLSEARKRVTQERAA